MKSAMIDSFLKICPNTKYTNGIISKVRIDRINSYFISAKEIENGEKSYEDKKSVVEKYVSMSWKDIKRTSNKADYVLSKASQYKNRDDKEKIKIDMLFKRLAYGFEPDEYLCFGLEKIQPGEIKNWMSDLDRYIYIFTMNNIKEAQVFNHKFKTYQVFGRYYGRNVIRIKTESDYHKFEKFLKEHSEFVKKPVFAGAGRGIELVKTNTISPRDYFNSLTKQGEHIIEERIYQSDTMAKLNISSVNTIRCITLNTSDGVKIIYTFLKVGQNGSFVDNGGAGGILAGIDEKTGIIITHGYDEFATEYIAHPNSGVIFKGYSFPQWNEMKSMCCEMANMIPNVRCIGWDMALTDNGWVVVEGNGATQFIGPQIVFKRGIKQEVWEYMKNVN